MKMELQIEEINNKDTEGSFQMPIRLISAKEKNPVSYRKPQRWEQNSKKGKERSTV